jgi:hypothetical protein
MPRAGIEFTTLTWSWLSAYRFEKLALLGIVVLLAAGEGAAIIGLVHRLFDPVIKALGFN